ncbi:MAG: hypothetical protein EOO75_14305 [Myxococcales bacterium]|nr:MAG: hypothetical protein EOO75_14305 [Myxococcales bacterium]
MREGTGRWPHGGLVGWMAGVGVFSYSLYLVHYPVRMVGKRLLMPWAQTSNPLVYLLVAALLAVAGYLAARVYFWLVERHFLNTR